MDVFVVPEGPNVYRSGKFSNRAPAEPNVLSDISLLRSEVGFTSGDYKHWAALQP